jgi:hypothetical protein
MQWVCRWSERYFQEGELVEKERLVVIDAADAEEAQRRTGLVAEEFAEATNADLDEWEDLLDEGLTDKDIRFALGALNAEVKRVGRRRRRDRETGRWTEDGDLSFDMNRSRAYRLFMSTAKLEDLMLEDETVKEPNVVR